MPGTETFARPRSGERHGRSALGQGGRADAGGGIGAGAPAGHAARVAHDIGTPVAIILGLCARLESGPLDATQRADLDAIRAQAGLITSSAAELAATTGEPAGPARDEPVVLDAARVAHEVADELTVLARERRARIVVDAGRGAHVLGDRARLRSALTNLVTNALRQVEPGGVVRCSVSALGARVTIAVADSGPGIPAGERRAVLRPGVQGSGARGASGLGLSIVHEATTALGGTLSIGDAYEGGAQFTLGLPRARQMPRRRRRHLPAR